MTSAWSVLTLSLLSSSGTARPSVDPPPLPPGGYYNVGDLPQTPPVDGERALLSGAIIFPLGAIRTGLGFMQVELAKPGRCEYTPASCRDLTTYGWIGVAYGGISAVTGLAFLGLGLARRNRLGRWKEARNLAWRFDPQLGRDRAALHLWVSF